jgi:hypothetical protein
MDADSSGGTTKIPICGLSLMTVPGSAWYSVPMQKHAAGISPAYQGI